MVLSQGNVTLEKGMPRTLKRTLRTLPFKYAWYVLWYFSGYFPTYIVHEKKSVPWRTLGDLRFSWYAGKCAREIKKKVISHGTRRTLKRTLKRTFC